MKTNKPTEFIWYASHPTDGELILLVFPKDHYKKAFIYAPRIIYDRVRHRMNPLITLELGCGPMGCIPWDYYREAGFCVPTPLQIRLLAMLENYSREKGEETSPVEKYDADLSAFILKEWNAKKFTIPC